ncbi:Rieske (2Fe-2S) protein [Streptomyces sp. N2-109]|uniref:Cytochrome bc1 complex Rieske iron-sulfur subunit n=1 Tax=Streptomyces gossypii TaxID=2883101 RepID=A0ABT2K3C0_9ACTN|nr:Rieske (2Fe-2S) protein [Streptomyces gossypii]MCT2594025.1 Rieske (2Fe-2S) protein [Streptomyces gossypii]
MTEQITSRRSVLAAAGAAGLAGPLTACGNGDEDSEGGDGYRAETSPDDTRTPKETETAGSPSPEESKGAELGRTSEVPQGGGRIFKSEKVVVTQPEAGEFKAYSAVCQHEGCLVASVSDGTINCACHGSKYDISDGGVAHGPTTKGLPEVNVSVEGGRIRLT